MTRQARRSAALALVLVLAAWAGAPVPAAAQGTDDTTTTQAPTTTAAPTTTTRPPATLPPTTTTTAPPTTAPPETVPPETTAPPTTAAPPPPTQPAPTPVDAIGEDGADDAPAVRPVPPGAPRARTPVDDAIARVVGGQIKAAKAVTARASSDALAANRVLADLEARQAQLQRTYESLFSSQAAAANELKAMRATMRTRAVALYLAGPSEPAIPVGTDIYSYGRRRVLIQALQEADKESLARYQQAKEAAGDAVNELVDRLEDIGQQVTAARAAAELRAGVVQRSLAGLGTLEASSAVAVNGFVFPVGEPYNFASTFGAPRMVGTSYYHSHQGNDIFAPYGTPLYACERGVIDKMGTNRLGGTKLWIVGQSGTTYYYAHLSAFAEGITNGTVVEAGAVVGYVGNSGNAITTPPHLHFEIHPGNGPAVDPYPILKTVADTSRRLGLGPTTSTLPPPAPGEPTGPTLVTSPVTAPRRDGG